MFSSKQWLLFTKESQNLHLRLYTVFHIKQCFTFYPWYVNTTDEYFNKYKFIKFFESLGRKSKVIQGFCPD